MRRTYRYLVIACLVLLILTFIPNTSPTVLSSNGEGKWNYRYVRFLELKVPAVFVTSEGVMQGVSTELYVGIAWPGNGTIYFSAEPLTQIDMQAASRVAAMVASSFLGSDISAYDYFVKVKSPSEIIGGPSASAVTTVAFLALLTGTNILPNVSMTGMIEPDGTIGPVGGVAEKLEAMAKSGIKVFLVPKGQLIIKEMKKVVENRSVGGVVIITEKIVPVKVNLTELGMKLGVKVIEVGSIVEAYKYLTGKELKLPRFKMTYPTWLINNLVSIRNEMVNKSIKYLTIAKKLLGTRYSEVVKTIEESIKKSNKLLEEGKYYSAASEAFRAIILSNYLYEIANAGKAKTVNEFFKKLKEIISIYINRTREVLNEVTNLIDNIDGGPLTDIKLQLAIASYARLLDANETLSEVYTSQLYPFSIGNDALYKAIYAYWRAKTSYQYAELAIRSLGGVDINRELLAKGISTLAHFALSVKSYLESLGGRGKEINYLEVARLISEGRYVEAATHVVTSLSRNVVLMHIYFNTYSYLTPYAEEGAKILAGRAQELGLTPVLPLIYLERAKTLEDTLGKLDMYEKVSAYSLLLISSIAKPKYVCTACVIPQSATPITTILTRTTTKTITILTTITKLKTKTEVSIRRSTIVRTVTVTSTSSMTETVTYTVTKTGGSTEVITLPVTIVSFIVIFMLGLIVGTLIGRKLS